MTLRLTVGQALVRFLAAQHTERDGTRQRLIAGCFGIFGHGNVAGFGQALLEAELESPDALPYVLGRNEQAMVHTAVAYARLPVVEDMERVLAASTLPALLLGGEVSADQEAVFTQWRKALRIPSVRGLVVGRTLLFPPDDDVAGAVDAAVGLLRG